MNEFVIILNKYKDSIVEDLDVDLFLSKLFKEKDIFVPRDFAQKVKISTNEANALLNVLAIESSFVGGPILTHYCVPFVDSKILFDYSQKGYAYHQYEKIKDLYGKDKGEFILISGYKYSK